MMLKAATLIEIWWLGKFGSLHVAKGWPEHSAEDSAL
jgi:hypothetical protein